MLLNGRSVDAGATRRGRQSGARCAAADADAGDGLRSYSSKGREAAKSVKGPGFRGGGACGRDEEAACHRLTRLRHPPDRSALKEYRPVSDGTTHIGRTLSHTRGKTWPADGPAGASLPLRIFPVGGLGEIGMNCMLVGNFDRYVMLDAGLMFPDGFDELGQQKVLPDVSFLHKYKEKVEAVVITHGHEDHIGALPWIVPALDRRTPIFANKFTMKLIKKRMTEFGLWDPERFFEYDTKSRFTAGPFEVQAVRVTHSIPDCCGLIFRCADGTVVHTGDWKIDEQPMDGEMFDRSAFEAVGQEGVTLFMSDSTNVLSPGRTVSESLVATNLLAKVSAWTSGRVIATCFASNVHRLEALKAAADATDRRLVLMGGSLSTYLEAAHKDGRATFSPASLLDAEEVEGYDPNKLLIVTTGSQAEPMAKLSRAAFAGARDLRLADGDLLLYSAKMIPGNEKRVMKMLNAISSKGVAIAMGRGEALHASGHAHRDELTEVLQLVRPQHFLPVHGEYAFLKEHEALGRAAGVRHTTVIRNGTLLGVGPLASRNAHGRSSGVGSSMAASAALQPQPPHSPPGRDAWQTPAHVAEVKTDPPAGRFKVLGESKLQHMYNDGTSSAGSREDMALPDRVKLSNDGLIVATARIFRVPSDVAAALDAGYVEGIPGSSGEGEEGDDRKAGSQKEVKGLGLKAGPRLKGAISVDTRAMYTAGGAYIDELVAAGMEALCGCSAASPPWEAARAVERALRSAARRLTVKAPEVMVTAFEAVPGPGEMAAAEAGATEGWARSGAGVARVSGVVARPASAATRRGAARGGGGGERGGGGRGGRGGGGGERRGGGVGGGGGDGWKPRGELEGAGYAR